MVSWLCVLVSLSLFTASHRLLLSHTTASTWFSYYYHGTLDAWQNEELTDALLRSIELKRSIQIVQLLLDHKRGDEDEPDEANVRALELAVHHNRTDIVKLLLDRGTNIEATFGPYHSTALMQAVTDVNPDMSTMLIDKGANVNAVNDRGDTPLNLAVWNEQHSLGLVQLLVARQADVNLHQLTKIGAELGWRSRRPVNAACMSGNLGVVQYLVDAGAVLHQEDIVWATIEVIPYLLGKGFGVDFRDLDTGNTALHAAAWTGDLGKMQFLLEHGADPNVLNRRNQTPIVDALREPGINVEWNKTISLLLKYKADINLGSFGGVYACPSCDGQCKGEKTVALLSWGWNCTLHCRPEQCVF